MDAATQRQEAIRSIGRALTSTVATLQAAVDEARENGDHTALGYPSWPAYLADTLDGTLADLSVGFRREVVAMLSAEGMSVRDIAPIVGVDDSTVSRDRRQVLQGAAPAATVGHDGKVYTPRERAEHVDAPPQPWKLLRAALHEVDEFCRSAREHELKPDQRERCAELLGHLDLSLAAARQQVTGGIDDAALAALLSGENTP